MFYRYYYSNSIKNWLYLFIFVFLMLYNTCFPTLEKDSNTYVIFY